MLLTMVSSISQGFIWGVMAIGVYLTYKILNFSDLTVDGSYALGGTVSVALILVGVSPWVSLLVSMVAGALAGMMTGLINTKLKIPGILASILVMTGLHSINLAVLSGKGYNSIPAKGAKIYPTIFGETSATSRDLDTIILVGIIIVIIIAILYWFFGTEVGSAIRATGNNEPMAKAQGINTDAMKILMLSVSNAIVALAGGIFAQNRRTINVTDGSGAIVIGLAAVVIGLVIFPKGNFAIRLLSAVVGSIIYQMIMGLVLYTGIHVNYDKLIRSVIVTIFLFIPTLIDMIKTERAIREAKNVTTN